LSVAFLREDAKVAVLWNYHVHEVDRCSAQVMIREDEASVRAAVRQVRGVFDADFAESIAHLRGLREAPREELRLNALSVDRNRQVVEHALRIGVLFVF
jgi:hypothetical protein